LPDELISALAQPNNFRVYRSVANIPDSVRSAFAKAADENSFLMADPNGRWEATDVIRAPNCLAGVRRLSLLAENYACCFMNTAALGRTITSPRFEFLIMPNRFGMPT
jgi:hypothetical protein